MKSIISLIVIILSFQLYASYELVLSEPFEPTGLKNRKNSHTLQISPTIIKEQPKAARSWLDIERDFREQFIARRLSYDLNRMINYLKCYYDHENTFKNAAKEYFKVDQPEYLAFLLHCCKLVREQQNNIKNVTVPQIQEIVQKVIQENTEFGKLSPKDTR